MGFIGGLTGANNYGKRHCRSLFWRVRATVKKAMKNSSKEQLKFHYDPSSYALNFDDGCRDMGRAQRENSSEDCKNITTWIYPSDP
ncbi:hypothetical protein RJ641_018251 [Dillenia turbinata]|uniref:Uncharacterized protein n=1 Tax=Dillenia turbinata TaxID=194707 RepID=A0AAN8UL31_9MAGN